MRESPSCRRSIASVGLSAALIATLCVAVVAGSASPIAAARGGITEILVLDEPDSAGPASADLSTMLLATGYGQSFDLVDLTNGNRTELGLSFDGYHRGLPALSSDGSILGASGSWEGVEPGDADGGFDDGFLYDVSSGELSLLTGVVPDSINHVVAMSGDGSRVVLASYPVFDGPYPSFSLWEDGTIAPLSMPDSLEFNSMTLSADGSTLVYSRPLGFRSVLVAKDLATGDERAVSGGYGYGYSVSDDGSTVAWLGSGGPVDEYGMAAGTVNVWATDGIDVASYDIGVHSDGGWGLLSGDGSTVSGTAYAVLDHETYETESTLWQLDLVSGEVETLYTQTQSDGGGGLYINGVNGDGSEIIFQTSGHTETLEPFSIDFDYGGSYRTQIWRWSADTPGVTTQAPEPGIHPALADQLGRLYEAYFGRAPDAGGLSFWLQERTEGQSLAAVSQAFASSPEFVDTYGELDDEAFVQLVYQNVLGRSADAAGLEYWTEQLASGVSRGWVMIGFSESPEFVAATGTSDPMSATEGTIRRMYWVFLGRDASDADLEYWTDHVDGGGSFTQMADVLASSGEFTDRWGQPEFWEVLELAIPSALGRFVTEDDYQRWGVPLESGELTIPHFLLAIANEPEVIAVTGTTPIGG